MLTPDQAAGLSASVLEAAGAWYVDPSSDALKIATTAVQGATFLLPAAGDVAGVVNAIVGALSSAVSARSIVLPGPKPLAIVSAADREDPVRFAGAAASLAVHAAQMRGVLPTQTLADYLDDEWRATHTAHAEMARSFVHHLLTGESLTVDVVMVDIAARALLPLRGDDIAEARGIVRSNLLAVADGIPTQVLAAAHALAWLRANAPDAIVPEAWRA